MIDHDFLINVECIKVPVGKVHPIQVDTDPHYGHQIAIISKAQAKEINAFMDRTEAMFKRYKLIKDTDNFDDPWLVDPKTGETYQIKILDSSRI